jgi:hypothetical protein
MLTKHEIKAEFFRIKQKNRPSRFLRILLVEKNIIKTPPQATGYQTENFKRPKGRGIKPSSAAGGLNFNKL